MPKPVVTLRYEEVVSSLRTVVATVAKVPEGEIHITAPFDEYGLDSIEVIEVTAQLEKQFGRKFSPTLLYEYPSIEQLAGHLTAS